MPWYDHLQGTYHKLQGSHRLNKIGMPMFPAAFTDSQLSPTARFASKSKSTSLPSSQLSLKNRSSIHYPHNQWMASSAPMTMLSNVMECPQYRLFSGDVILNSSTTWAQRGTPLSHISATKSTISFDLPHQLRWFLYHPQALELLYPLRV